MSYATSYSMTSLDEVCNQSSPNQTQPEISIHHMVSQILTSDFDTAKPTPYPYYSTKSTDLIKRRSYSGNGISGTGISSN